MITKKQSNKLRQLIRDEVAAAVNKSWAGAQTLKVKAELEEDFMRAHNKLKKFIQELTEQTN